MPTGEADTVNHDFETHESGDPTVELQGPGSLVCTGCGYALSMTALEDMPATSTVPTCPACGGTEFKRASIFERSSMDEDAIVPRLSAPAWLAEVRADLGPEPHIAWFDSEGEGPRTVQLEEGWTRIGRAVAAGIRLDDPSVSRRHAVVVRTETGELRALDDRSLNGLFVNGEKVEWTKLADGDELEIGAFRLYVINPG
jgi:hypothetical protein